MEKQSIQIYYENHSVNIPYYTLKGSGNGPHIFLSGGMHGDEINGIAVINEFLNWAQKKDIETKMNGQITVFPLLNPSGFAHMQRRVYEDNRDPNRAFGKEEPGTFTEQIAFDLTDKILKHCDFGMDFHDAGGRTVLLPHSRVHKDKEGNFCSGCTKELGQLLGTEIVIEREGREQMMAVALFAKYQIPVLTVEAGGAQRLFKEHIDLVVQGIRNVLTAKKIYKSELVIPEKQFYLHGRYGVRTSDPAQLEFNVKLGDEIHVGDEIGHIYFPATQKRERIKAPMCGRLFSLWQQSQIPKNMTMFSVLEDKECHIKRSTTNKFEEMPEFDITQIQM